MGERASVPSTVPYLRIDRVTKTFGDFAALKDVSLDIYKSEFVCFLGPSGCGKTTLLRAIAGLDVQTKGSVHQDGRDISELPPSRRDFGIVFQSYALFPNLTVAKNVGYGLENRRLQKTQAAARVKELLELVGLPEQGNKYPAQLSGGQQQRVALARALATSPGLLLLDEPLSALDAKVRVHLRHEIKELQRGLGVTTIMVTHDQEEALAMADRIVIMNQGAIDQVGTPAEIYNAPASPFVADFIGTMNFLHGVVAEDRRVRVGDVHFAAKSGCDGHAPGTEVSVCVRPEDVLVRDVGVGAGNALETTIARVEFLGSFYRTDLRFGIGNGQMIMADLSTTQARHVGVQEGQALTVSLPEERIRIFSRT